MSRLQNFLTYMDDQQKAAVTAPIDSPVLVLAGAGSGKTRVLMLRIIHLLDNGLEPEKIIVTTFSKKSADELQLRLGKVLSDVNLAKRFRVGTIHSLCFRILKNEGIDSTIMTEYSRQKIMEQSLSSLGGCPFGWKYPEYWIGRCKSALIPPAEAKDFLYKRLLTTNLVQSDAQMFSSWLTKVYIDYESDKLQNNYIDFDDMLYLVGRKIKLNKNNFKEMLQDKVDYVLIDEAQDDSELAVWILETLAAPENRIFMAADDMQTLYGWNGADTNSNVFGFMTRYPNAKMYKIETNYRSTKNIVNTSNKLVDFQYTEDMKDFKKFLKPSPESVDGIKVIVNTSETTSEESENVVSWIKEIIINDKQDPKDFFVLYRTNAQSRSIEEELIKNNIPYTLTNGLGFYDRAPIKDILSFIQLSEDRTDNDSFRRIANIASKDFESSVRYLGAQFFSECNEKDPVLWQGMIKNRDFQPRRRRLAIDDFTVLMSKIDEAGQHNPTKTIMAIRDLVYDNYILHKLGIPEGNDTNDVLEDIVEFQSSVSRFETNEEFLRYVSIIRRKNKEKKGDEANVVTLSTVHKVKGLEKNNVAIIGMNEMILPHWRTAYPELATDQLPIDIKQSIEDERCICFVAVTRAKERLLIDVLQNYRGKYVEPSRFLKEMNL